VSCVVVLRSAQPVIMSACWTKAASDHVGDGEEGKHAGVAQPS
jgi:hypothetical protein